MTMADQNAAGIVSLGAGGPSTLGGAGLPEAVGSVGQVLTRLPGIDSKGRQAVGWATPGTGIVALVDIGDTTAHDVNLTADQLSHSSLAVIGTWDGSGYSLIVDPANAPTSGKQVIQDLTGAGFGFVLSGVATLVVKPFQVVTVVWGSGSFSVENTFTPPCLNFDANTVGRGDGTYGAVPAAALPAPGASTRGGVALPAGATGKFYRDDGTWASAVTPNGTSSQVTLGDGSKGNVPAAALPAPAASSAGGVALPAASTGLYYRDGGTWADPAADAFSSGLDAALPAAASGLVGHKYYATDTDKLYYCVSATEWMVVGPGASDKATVGPFSDSAYISAGPGAAVGPVGSQGYTWALLFYVESLPGTAAPTFWHYSNAAVTKGWFITGSASAANTMRICIYNGSLAVLELPGAALTTGVHSLAICYKTGGTSVHYAFDGVTKTPVATSGAYVAPDSGCTHYIGRAANGGFSASQISMGALSAFAADVSDADLNTLSGATSRYRLGAISTNPVFQWRASWHRDGDNVHRPSGSQAVRMPVTGVSSLPIVYR